MGPKGDEALRMELGGTDGQTYTQTDGKMDRQTDGGTYSVIELLASG